MTKNGTYNFNSQYSENFLLKVLFLNYVYYSLN